MLPLTHLAGKTVAVVGLGRAGLATISALLAGEAEVIAWDDMQGARERAAELGAEVSAPAEIAWDTVALMVLSPGIPLTHPKPHPAVTLAKQAGCPVVGDVELLYRQMPDRHYVGITGTNGKSTTTALISHLLQVAGRPVAMGGNIGIAALGLDDPGTEGSYVLELSSYQLDLMQQFHCNCAVWLNITPDHLERHGGLEGYIAAKRRIFRHMTPEDVAVIGIDDGHSRRIYEAMVDYGKGPRLIAITHNGEHKRLPTESISMHEQPDGSMLLRSHMQEDERVEVALAGIASLRGRHNAQNAAAALAVGLSLGLPGVALAEAMRSFAGLAHRMEEVAVIGGVRFVNDSKATNAEATARALSAYESIYWIAGGVAKADGISSLYPYMKRVRKAYLIGEAAPAFAQTLKGQAEVVMSGTLEEAVTAAAQDARAAGEQGATVLLSPACASFDQFKDFEARGEAFRECVEQLQQKQV